MALRANRSCPTDDDLLRLASGDLSSRQAARVRAHVTECSICRDHMADSGAALGAFRDHSESDSDTPQWATFSRALRHEEEAWKRGRILETRRRWSGAAAIAATLIVALIWQRQAEVTLSAATVVSRAIAYEEQQPEQTAKPLWIRHSGANPQPREGLQNSRIQSASFEDAALQPLIPASVAAQELARRLTAYGFDITAPLSARHFQQWRHSTTPNERLESLNGALLKVSASARAGEVRQAELIVREGTFEPVSQNWMFADGFRVALTSLPNPARPTEELRAATDLHEPPPTPARPSIDLQSTELALRAALYHARVPVGLGVTVARESNQIVVQGDVDASETLAKMHAYARQTDGVRIQVRLKDLPSLSEPIHESSGLQLWLDQAMPNAELRDQFLKRALEHQEQLRIAAAVLAHLARRYPEESAAKLPPDQQAALTALAGRQLLDLTTAYTMLEQDVAALVGTISRPMMPTGLPTDWQERSLAADQQVSVLSTAFSAVLTETTVKPEDFTSFARGHLRPTLEAVAAAIASHPTTP